MAEQHRITVILSGWASRARCSCGEHFLVRAVALSQIRCPRDAAEHEDTERG